MTFEEVRNFTKTGGDAKFTLEEAIRNAVNQEKELDAAIEDARSKGNAEVFARQKAERELLQEKIRGLRDRLSKCPPYTRSDVCGAWQERVKQHNSEFDRKYSEYVKLRKQLFDKFMELYRMQESVIDDRATVQRIANPAAAKLSRLPKSRSDIRFENKAAAPEIAFFVDAGLLQGSLVDINSDLLKMNSVLLGES